MSHDPSLYSLSALIEALTIFNKYSNPVRPTNCCHDVLFVKATDSSNINPEDLSRLGELGFIWDDNDGWYSFRFGSC